MQLSDLSRCAGDIFGGILSEADSLCHRNARLQRRLGALETLLARLDHRKVKILNVFVQVNPFIAPEVKEVSNVANWSTMCCIAVGAPSLQPLQVGDFLICQERLDLCHVL
ncbi:hypothetical protein Q9233_013673 [Columba guinea]|nr:hypothetical protein Q9233_013673 [Columba guinea]